MKKVITAVLAWFLGRIGRSPQEIGLFLSDMGLVLPTAPSASPPLAETFRHTGKSIAGDRIRKSHPGRLVLPEYWDRKKGLDAKNRITYRVDPYFNWVIAGLGVLVGYICLILVPLILTCTAASFTEVLWQKWLTVGILILSLLPKISRNAKLIIAVTLIMLLTLVYGGWSTYIAPAVYFLVMFLPGLYVGMLKEDQGRTIERFGIPFREYGKNKGLWICFPFEKARPFWSAFLELEYKDKFQCTDEVVRPASIEIPIRIVRMWALQRLVATEILELTPLENGMWKRPDEKRAVTRLKAVFESDVLALVRQVFHEVPYPADDANMEAFALKFRQELAKAVEEFFHAAVEVGEIGFHFLPSEAEQKAAQRVKAAKDDGAAFTTKVQTIYDALLTNSPTFEDENPSQKQKRCWLAAEEAAKKDLDREGLEKSGSGLAAGRKTGNKDKPEE